MNQKFSTLKVASMALLSVSVLMLSCKKDQVKVAEDANVSTEKNLSKTSAYPSNINTSFSHSDGTYTYGQASADMGNATLQNWQESRAWISGGWARATLMPNSVSNGLITQADISDGSAYEATFKMRFHSQFDWSRGGKVGFGFLIGDGNTGCDVATDGNGGSLRLMWYNTGSRVFLQPYVYHRDMAGPCGDTFGKSYPSSGSLVKGQTYTVHMYVVSNTGSNKNGRVQVKVDGTTVIDQAIRWTTNDSKRLINRLSFHNFRGGKDIAVWGSSQTSYIYFDDLVVNKIQ